MASVARPRRRDDAPSDAPDAVLRYAAHEAGLIDVHLPADVTAAGPAGRLRARRLLAGGVRPHPRPPAGERARVRRAASSRCRSTAAAPTPGRAPSPTWTPRSTALPGLLDGLGLRTTTTTLVGHSAGGHLVLWLANERHAVDRVVALAPVGDLRFAAETGMGSGATVDFLGGTPDEVPEAYDAADPAPGWRPVRTARSSSCTATATTSSRSRPAAGSPPVTRGWTYRELPGVDHFDVIDPLSAAWPTVLPTAGRG